MTLDELKMLLALNGNVRIPYAEEEIFTSKDLYTYYLIELSKDKPWFRYFDITDPSADTVFLIYRYSREILKVRWLEAECVVFAQKGRDRELYMWDFDLK
jgi:hypothetical protein